MVLDRLKRAVKDFVSVLWQLARSTVARVRESDLRFLAGSLAFTSVLSLVPLLAVSLSVFHALGGFESLLNKIQPFIIQNLVTGSGVEASRFLRRAISRIHSSTLGFGGVIGLMLASTKVFHDFEVVVQRIWQLKSKRPLMARWVVYWLIIFAGPLVLAVVLGLLGSKDLAFFRSVPKDAVAIGIAFILLAAIYKFTPACRVRWGSAFLSAGLAAVAVGTAQSFYAIIMKKMFRYSKVYGSLASVPVFLIWILILWWICLVGVALCATLDEYLDRRSIPRDPVTPPSGPATQG